MYTYAHVMGVRIAESELNCFTVIILREQHRLISTTMLRHYHIKHGFICQNFIPPAEPLPELLDHCISIHDYIEQYPVYRDYINRFETTDVYLDSSDDDPDERNNPPVYISESDSDLESNVSDELQ